MHRELVDERRWVSEDRFLHALSYCTLIPGPEAQQLAIYLGWLLSGTFGGIIAGVLFVIPGYVAIMALSLIYAGFGDTKFVTAIFAGVAPAVLAIVAQAVLRVGGRALKNKLLLGIAVGAFLALFFFAVPFPIVLAVAAVVGFAGGRLRPDLCAANGHGKGPNQSLAPEIPDEALTRVVPTFRRAASILVIGVIAWVVPVLALALAFGRDSIFVEQGKFFGGTALVTFGGAYAVLSYVAQKAVYTYQWLLPGEMIKGLAMAETTPGPLIQVVQFVAFLGAYRSPGSINPWVAGIVASTLVTWVTYVPCFLFIFIGAPHVERLRNNHNLTAALSAVTAAVVGVIANLALFFAVHTLFATVRINTTGPLHLNVPVWSTVSYRAVAVAVLAMILAFRFKRSVPRILGVCAVVGATMHLAAS